MLLSYPELFAKALDDGISAAAVGKLTDTGLEWCAATVLANNSTDTTLLWQQLVEDIGHIDPSCNDPDTFSWTLNPEAAFSVQSCYQWFFAKLLGPPLNINIIKASSYI